MNKKKKKKSDLKPNPLIVRRSKSLQIPQSQAKKLQCSTNSNLSYQISNWRHLFYADCISPICETLEQIYSLVL